MSKLELIIPSQNVELIRDRIATILVDEIANQIVLGADLETNSKVFVERFHAIDKSEAPVINLMYARTGYDNNTAITSDGKNAYHIDHYTKGKTTDLKKGDRTSKERLLRNMGITRAILESPHYLTLGFAPPFIMRTTVISQEIADPRDDKDGSNMSMGRLTFEVDAVEDTEQITPRVAEGYDTTVIIEETALGHLYILDN